MKNATAKNDVQVIQKALEEYLGNRKAAKVAVEISAAMQEETQHTHKGEVFYIHKDEVGALVLTMESNVKNQVGAILNPYLEKDEVEEFLEWLMGEQPLDATAETAEFETIKVEGSESMIYAKLMEHVTESEREIAFMMNLKKAISASVPDFEVFACDPSIDKNGKLQFVPGFKPAVGYSYNELDNLAKENGLRLGNKYEYVLFLGTLISQLIAEGWSEAEAWHSVCVDSEELGHYINSADAKNGLELTGSRKIAGKCDLANTRKILAKDACGFWLTGGCYFRDSYDYPLADLNLCSIFGNHGNYGVGWFVL